MLKKTLLAFLIWITVGCFDSSPEEPPREYEVAALVRSRIASMADTVGPFLEFPTAMIPWKDSLAVVDMRGPSVVVLPWSLRGGREFGVAGEGPGEFRKPQGIATVGDTLVIFDRSNGRLSWFGPEGEFRYGRRLMILGVTPTFEPRPGGIAIVPTGMSSHYAVVDSPEDQVPYLERPTEGMPPEESPLTFNRVVAVGAECAVVDVENGIVAFETPEGGSIPYPLPAEFQRQIEPRLDSLRAEDPAGERAIFPIFTAGEAPSGVLVWFTGKGDPAGAIVTRAGEWSPLTISEGLQEFPSNPFAVVLRGEELVTLHNDGLRLYTVR